MDVNNLPKKMYFLNLLQKSYQKKNTPEIQIAVHYYK